MSVFHRVQAPATPGPERITLGDIQPGSAGEAVINGFANGHGCSAINKILSENPVEQRGAILRQADGPYQKSFTYSGTTAGLHAVSISTDVSFPLLGQYGHPESMRFVGDTLRLNRVQRDNGNGKMETIFWQEYDPKTMSVKSTYCKDQ